MSNVNVVSPPNQVKGLNEKDLDSEITHMLTSQNPEAPDNIVRFSYRDRCFHTEGPISQTQFHIEIDGPYVPKQQTADYSKYRDAPTETESRDETSNKPLRNQFNYSHRGTQTTSEGSRSYGVNTHPSFTEVVRGTFSRSIIYDAYVAKANADRESESLTQNGVPITTSSAANDDQDSYSQAGLAVLLGQLPVTEGRRVGDALDDPYSFTAPEGIINNSRSSGRISRGVSASDSDKNSADKQSGANKGISVSTSTSTGNESEAGGNSASVGNTGIYTILNETEITSLSQSLLLAERLVGENLYTDVVYDFKYWDDPADAYKTDGSLLPLWKFSCDFKQIINNLFNIVVSLGNPTNQGGVGGDGTQGDPSEAGNTGKGATGSSTSTANTAAATTTAAAASTVTINPMQQAMLIKATCDIQWHPVYTDMFAVGFGSLGFQKSSIKFPSCIAVYSLKNPFYPEVIIQTPADCNCIDWHPTLYNLMLAGFSDGHVTVYELCGSKTGGYGSYKEVASTRYPGHSSTGVGDAERMADGVSGTVNTTALACGMSAGSADNRAGCGSSGVGGTAQGGSVHHETIWAVRWVASGSAQFDTNPYIPLCASELCNEIKKVLAYEKLAGITDNGDGESESNSKGKTGDDKSKAGAATTQTGNQGNGMTALHTHLMSIIQAQGKVSGEPDLNDPPIFLACSGDGIISTMCLQKRQIKLIKVVSSSSSSATASLVSSSASSSSALASSAGSSGSSSSPLDKTGVRSKMGGDISGDNAVSVLVRNDKKLINEVLSSSGSSTTSTVSGTGASTPNKAITGGSVSIDGVLSIAFAPGSDWLYGITTDSGACKLCSTAYSSNYIQTFSTENNGHTMPVYSLSWNYYDPDIFATASDDWTVKIWMREKKTPLTTLDLGVPVCDAAFSPMCSCVLVCATLDGRLLFFDFSQRTDQPICAQRVIPEKSNVKITKICLNKKFPVVAVGDSQGITRIFKLSPNLRTRAKVESQKNRRVGVVQMSSDEILVKEYELEVRKIRKFVDFCLKNNAAIGID